MNYNDYNDDEQYFEDYFSDDYDVRRSPHRKSNRRKNVDYNIDKYGRKRKGLKWKLKALLHNSRKSHYPFQIQQFLLRALKLK